MSNETWQLDVDRRVQKILRRIPQADADAISAVIDRLADNPYAGDIEKMKGESNAWRRRIGSYRVFYRIYPDRRFVSVFLVERRTSTTY